jgi:uncharacterized SAM-binding protein YcdF (DUF218 family)
MIVVKTLLAPGTFLFAILVAVVAALLIRRRGWSRRFGAALLVLLAASYFVLSLPYMADRLSAPLIQFGPLSEVDHGKEISAIVVLSGDSQHARVVETLRLATLLATQPIIVSGPDEIRDAILEGGISPSRIVMETASETTHGQAVNVGQLVRSKGLGRIALIASAVHMPRALAAFRAEGIDAVASASATRPIAALPRFWPAYSALQLSRDSIYEYIALVYYRWRGWR